MKIRLSRSAANHGFALIMVMVIAGVSITLLTAAMYRSNTVTKINQRNNDYIAAQNAAEAAVEKVFANMSWNFQSYGPSTISNSVSSFQTNVPSTAEDSYWSRFIFSDGQGNTNRTYVAWVTNYTGYLPSVYTGLQTADAPVYRLISNAYDTTGGRNVIGTAQIDVLLALVPLVNYAIFYNGNLEFTQCATMSVNGRTHANGSIAVGTTASLNFYSAVSCTSTLSAPGLDGQSDYDTWNTYFSNSPAYTTNVATVTVSLNMTNSHFLIETPTNGESPTSVIGKQRLYNQAQMILLVTNNAAGVTTNPTVTMILQASVNGAVPGNDPAAAVYVYTNCTPTMLASNLPFLDLDNLFYDRRETKTNIVTDIDVGRLGTWAATNSRVQSKLSAASSVYPTILYVADTRRPTTTQPGQMNVVRLKNGAVIPSNGSHGFTVATMNPVYVMGNYNIQQTSGGSSSAGTTNTAYTYPAAIMSDSFTILSSNWSDAYSTTTFSSTDNNYDASYDTTINAAIVTGSMPSTGTSATTFSGGVHNLPRLLQDWNSRHIWLNTSILRLWDSTIATNQFRNPSGFTPTPSNPYYRPPTRHYNYDLNFLNPAKVPPGIPNAMMPIRFGYTIPAPNVVTNTPIWN